MHHILILEDHPMMVDAIKVSVQGLPFRMRVWMASTLGELQSNPQIAVLRRFSLIVADLNLPDSQGLATLHRLRTRFPDSPVLVFSQIDDPTIEAQVMALGAAGYASKSHQPKVFIERMRSMLSALPHAVQDSVAENPYQPPLQTQLQDDMQTLTVQQRKILQLLALGRSNAEVAEQLEIAESTVKAHLTEIYQRLNVKNRTQAIVFYLNWASQTQDD
jgi:DNA-binding NarL/FixJ family response regulator